MTSNNQSHTEEGKVDPSLKLFVGTIDQFPFIQGRREFLNWRDLGVAEPSNNFMRAEIISLKPGVMPGTGWHYHPAPCIGQFFYVFGGWCDLEFEDGSLYRLKKGDAGFIPGGMRHQAYGMSDDYEAMEISFPGTIETVNCEKPENLP